MKYIWFKLYILLYPAQLYKFYYLSIFLLHILYFFYNNDFDICTTLVNNVNCLLNIVNNN